MLYHIICYYTTAYCIICYYTLFDIIVYVLESSLISPTLIQSMSHALRADRYTRLVSTSAPTWSSKCCFTACHF